ncbi:MAG TPA: hypothetical protein ENG85_03050 [Bacteroidetes bacterium]|nr:hypothetical protein [Bacteroidota bacterium]
MEKSCIKKIVLISLVILFTLPVMAQKEIFPREQALQRKNNVSLTLGGNGLFLSLSYDRIIAVKPGYFIDANVGIGVFPGLAGANVSHQIIINKGKRSSFFMFGLGGTYEWHKTDASGFTETQTSYNLSPIMGWKKIFRNHLLFSIYASPMIHIAGNNLYIYGIWHNPLCRNKFRI